MSLTNRRGDYNDMMFKDMEQFAQHVKNFDNFHYECKVEVNGVDKFKVEDLRAIFNKPGKVQAKMRVSELLPNAGIISFKKKDTVKVIIQPKAPSKEPKTIITVKTFFEETEGLVPNIDDVLDVKVMPNKWLYIEGIEG